MGLIAPPKDGALVGFLGTAARPRYRRAIMDRRQPFFYRFELGGLKHILRPGREVFLNLRLSRPDPALHPRVDRQQLREQARMAPLLLRQSLEEVEESRGVVSRFVQVLKTKPIGLRLRHSGVLSEGEWCRDLNAALECEAGPAANQH